VLENMKKLNMGLTNYLVGQNQSADKEHEWKKWLEYKYW